MIGPAKMKTRRRTNMKNRFVKISLILTMLFVVAMPAQVFAAEKSCNLNRSNGLNSQVSKIYGQVSQDKLAEVLKQCQKGKVDSSQLQDLWKQYCQKSSAPTTCNKNTTPEKPEAANPSKPEATNPEKPEATTPDKPTTNVPSTKPETPSTPDSSTLGTYEQQVVDLVNKERAAAGLSALKVNTKLASVAEKKAEDMRDNNYFSHTSPTYGSPFDMMKQFGISYTSAGENIAKGQRTPSEVMDGWMNSSGHRANILNSSYTEIGVGYVTDSNGNTYWVQQFIRP